MKKLVTLALGAAIAVSGAQSAHAAKHWDDMSWWGNTGAQPAPVPDSQGRSGYWWWPTEAASNNEEWGGCDAASGELWGNRGIVYHTWEQAAKEEVAEAPAPTPPAAVERTVPVLNNILFDFDKAVLKPEGQAVANEAVAELKKWKKDTVLIEGHTDSVGSDAYNMALGQRRADAVSNYLTSNGVEQGRVSTKSYGESQPAVPNDTAANRKLNRRAVFKFTVGQYAPGEVQ